MVDNIKITEQLKKLQIDIANMVEAQNKALQAQGGMLREITEMYKTIGAQDTIGNLENLSGALEKAGEAARKSGSDSQNTMNSMNQAISQGEANQQKLNTASAQTYKTLTGFGGAAGVFDGLASGMMFSVRSAKMLGTFMKSLLKSVFAVSAGIIAMPFRMLGGLINDAGSGGGSSELLQNLEKIREEFGDLRSTAGGAIVQIARNMKGQLANTGLSTWRTFGNLAERLAEIQKYAHAMGSAFEQVAGQMVQASEAIGAYIKGLGFTEEAQKGLAQMSYALGRDMVDISREIASSSVQMGDQFGISSKLISRDVGDMIADFKVFGNLAPQTLVNISVFARKLGVELKGLLGIVDRFDNFEDAAKGAAQLGQAFGIQVDALAMMKAQDPAERIEMLRKGFFAAGRSIENMTRQERALLAQQTGLEDSALRMVFAQKNQSVSYADVQKKGAAAQKSQMTQAESLKAIADQIQRLVKGGGGMQGGFFERFMQGFDTGIKRTREYRKLMINLRKALKGTFRAGREVGRAFMHMFPGMKQVFGSLANFFEPRRFRTLLGGIVNAFKDFFKDLSGGGGRLSFKKLINKIKETFLNYFNRNSTDGRNLLEGIKKFFMAMSQIFAGGLQMAMEGLTTGIRFIIDLLSGKQSLSGLAAGGQGAMGFVMQLFQPVIAAMSEAWPALRDAAWELIQMGFHKLKDLVMSNLPLLAGYFLGPAVMSAIFKSMMTSMTGALAGGFVNSLREVFNPRNAAVTRGIAAASTDIASAAPATGAGATAGPGMRGLVDSFRSLTVPEIMKLGLLFVVMAGAVSVGMVMFAGALRAVVAVLAPVTNEELIRAFGVVTVAVLGMVGISAAARLLNGVDTVSLMRNLAVGMVALVAVLGVMALVMIGLRELNFSEAQSSKASAAMMSMTKIFMAAAAVAVVAGAAGAILLATGGIGGVAIGIGLLALGAVIGAMAIGAMAIMKKIDRLSIGEGFQEKFDAFIRTTEMMTDFATIFAGIISDLSPSIVDYFLGDPEKQIKDMLDGVNKILEGTITGFTSIITIIMEQSAILGNSPQVLQGATALGSLLGSVLQLVQALQPPEGWNEGLVGSLMSTTILSSIATYVFRLSSTMIVLIRNVSGLVQEFLRGLGTIGGDQMPAVQAFGGLMGSVGTLLNAFKPDSAIAGLIQNANENDASLISHGSDNLDTVMTSISEFATMMIGVITSSGIFGKITTLISTIISSISGLSAPQLEKMVGIIPLFTSIFDLVGNLMNAIKPDEGIVDLSGAQIISYINSMASSVPKIMVAIEGTIPNIIASLLRVSDTISAPQMTKLNSTVSMLSSIFTLIAGIPAIINSFGQAPGGAQGSFDQDAFNGRLGNISTLITSLFRSDGPMSSIMSSLSTMSGNTRGLRGRASVAIRSAIEFIQGISTMDFGSVTTFLTQGVGTVTEAAGMTISANISNMINQVNTIADSLGTIPITNISTQLRRLGARFELGSSDEITLNHRNFKIEIRFDVKIDAEDLAKVLVNTPNSRLALIPS